VTVLEIAVVDSRTVILMPPFSLGATLVNIRIKLILSERLHFCRW